MSRQRFASRADLIAQMNSWSPSFLECRTLGHTWQSYTAREGEGKRGEIRVVVYCPRCTSKKFMDIGPRGNIVRQWIDYPDGYLSEGLGRIVGDERNVLRMEMIHRVYQVSPLTLTSRDVT